MTVFFRPDIVAPHDPAGFGLWRIGHYLEHQALIKAAGALTPPTRIADYDLAYWQDEPIVVTSWLARHAQVHLALRIPANFSGIDLSEVDLSDDTEWDEWHANHSQEHQALRAFYGLF